MKANYHTHTVFCNHGEYTIEQNIQNAINLGLDIIGISEHQPFEDGKGKFRLRDLDHLEEYLVEATMLKEKYKLQIDVRVGLEVEVWDNRLSKEMIPFTKDIEADERIDYTILGHHFFTNNKHSYDFRARKEEWDSYVLQLEKACREYTKLIYIAHPDCWVNGHGKWDELAEKRARDIIEISNKYNKPLGVNVSGRADGRSYANLDFFKIAREMNGTAILELDAHYKKHWDKKWIQKAIDVINESGVRTVEDINVK